MRDRTEDQIKEQQKEQPNEQARDQSEGQAEEEAKDQSNSQPKSLAKGRSNSQLKRLSKDQLELFLIRHGETASNRERRYLGRTQEPLSQEGRAELLALKQEGIYPEAGIVFSSPMQRCLETAGILYPGKTPIVISEWREIDFGDFEGKNAGELQGDPRYQAWIDSGGTLPFPGGESREEFIRRCCMGLDKMLDMLRNMEICFQNPAAGYKQGAGDPGGRYGRRKGVQEKNIREEGPQKEGCLEKDIQKNGIPETGFLTGKVCAVVHGGTIMALLSKFGGGEYFDYQVPCGRGYQCILQYDRSGGPGTETKAGRAVSVSRIE